MDISRRDLLKMAAVGGGAALAGCSLPVPEAPKPSLMPAVFISHGSPMVALRPDAYTKALGKMGEELPKPKAILIVSAHWKEEAPLRVTGEEKPETFHDFYGFPKELAEMAYPCPGHPALAGEVMYMLTQAGMITELDVKRGLDHGAWVPMTLAYPKADVPVIQVTLGQEMEPKDLYAMGAALAPLRAKGVMIVGSGGITHNFEEMDSSPNAKTGAWCSEFDTWVRTKVEERDMKSLLDYYKVGPNAERALPTTEHFDPLFVVMGATGPQEKVRDVYEGFHHANLSMRTFRVG